MRRTPLVIALILAALAFAPGASAQPFLEGPVIGERAPTGSAAGGAAEEATPEEMLNPASVLESAAEAIPGFDGGLSGALNVLVLLTVLTLAPSIVIMTTSFVRIIIVLGLLKQALGTQALPPSQVIFGLALIMTMLVMKPTVDRVYEEAVIPYQQGELASQLDMWNRAKQPMRDFMFDQIEATGNWSSVYVMLNYQGVDTSDPASLTRADVDTLSLVGAFMLSELKTAFLIGFKIYLPFLIVDMIIASLLISMSMMMLPPVLISLPFKILLFVMVDGWRLIVESLMLSFVQPEMAQRLSSMAGG